MTARTDEVRSVVEAEARTISSIDCSKGERAIITTGRLATFRACIGARILGDDGTIAIDSIAADLLDVKPGDTVWSVAR